MYMYMYMYVLYLWTGRVIYFLHPNNLLLNHLKTKGNNIWYLGSVMTALHGPKFSVFSRIILLGENSFTSSNKVQYKD